MEKELDALDEALEELDDAKAVVCAAMENVHGSEYEAHMCHLAQATACAVHAIGEALHGHLEHYHGRVKTTTVHTHQA